MVFHNCSSLQELVFPDSLTSMGYQCTDGCSGLRRIVVGNGLSSMGDIAFPAGIEEVVLGDGITSVRSYAFSGCSALRRIVLGKQVQSIGEYAFSNCTSLEEIAIPDTVTSLGNVAFNGCTGLKRLRIGDGVTTLGSFMINDNYSVFYNNAVLEEVVIGDGVTEIPPWMFGRECGALSTLVIGNSVTNIGQNAFPTKTSYRKVIIGDGVTDIAPLSMRYAEGLELCVVGSGVGAIPGYAWNSCSALRALVLKDGPTSLGNSLFKSGAPNADLVVPLSVTSISEYAFISAKFTTLYLPGRFRGVSRPGYCPQDTRIVYYDSYDELQTANSPNPVPLRWLESFPDLYAASAGDHEAEAVATAANGRPVWECHVADLDPTDPDDDFVVGIEIVDGGPRVYVERGESSNRVYRVHGATTLGSGAQWDDVTGRADLDETNYRFFKATVSLPAQP